MSWILYAGVAYIAYRLAKGPVTKAPKKAPRQARRTGLEKAYETLEVEPSASDEEVRTAYQEKVRAYHPDRVASAAVEIQALAEKRTKELNAAYATIRESRSGNLPPNATR